MTSELFAHCTKAINWEKMDMELDNFFAKRVGSILTDVMTEVDEHKGKIKEAIKNEFGARKVPRTPKRKNPAENLRKQIEQFRILSFDKELENAEPGTSNAPIVQKPTKEPKNKPEINMETAQLITKKTEQEERKNALLKERAEAARRQREERQKRVEKNNKIKEMKQKEKANQLKEQSERIRRFQEVQAVNNLKTPRVNNGNSPSRLHPTSTLNKYGSSSAPRSYLNITQSSTNHLFSTPSRPITLSTKSPCRTPLFLSRVVNSSNTRVAEKPNILESNKVPCIEKPKTTKENVSSLKDTYSNFSQSDKENQNPDLFTSPRKSTLTRSNKNSINEKLEALTITPKNQSPECSNKKNQNPIGIVILNNERNTEFKQDTNEDYNINDLDSGDETDSEANPRKEIPKWALKLAIQRQESLWRRNITPDQMDRFFGRMKQPNIEDFFNDEDKDYPSRNSSAIWRSPFSDPTPGESKYLKLTKK